MRIATELKALKLTPDQEKLRNNFVFNALATVAEINQGTGRENTPTCDLIEIMNIGTDYALDPEGYLKRQDNKKG
ncbi:hypothetical protein [Bacillus thuringiensis]|uniref:Uncharacterized protein n=1 Tax=Bacillus thuringiensis TaxID=1428 RepID=A0A4Y8T4X8_BACTU|nr:hypothetical protein [Bacillus thuringiensis]TFF45797.1 hypothetical protein EQ803_16150 [Bacillus thuringiensis]